MVASGPTEIWGVVFFLGYMPKKSDFLNPFSVWWRKFFSKKFLPPHDPVFGRFLMIFWKKNFLNFGKIVKNFFRKKSQKIFLKIRNFSVSTLLNFQNIFPNIQNFARSRKIELKIIKIFFWIFGKIFWNFSKVDTEKFLIFKKNFEIFCEKIFSRFFQNLEKKVSQKIIKNRPKTGLDPSKKILEKKFLHHT